MNRRIATTSLALALALSPALALAQGTSPGTASPTAAAKAHQAEMGEMETSHAKRTMTLGALSLETSRIALDKLKDDDLKQFAKFEVTEQEGIATVLKSMQEPDSTATTSRTPTAPTEAEVSANLDADGKEMIEKLRAAKAGPQFDAMYLKGQLATHEKLLDAQQDYLKSGRDREHRAVALLSSGQIKEHIALLKEIRSDMKDDAND